MVNQSSARQEWFRLEETSKIVLWWKAKQTLLSYCCYRLQLQASLPVLNGIGTQGAVKEIFLKRTSNQ